MKIYLSELTADKSTEYSLWKSTKYLKRPTNHIPPIRCSNGQWAKSNEEKATVFADHLANTFKPNDAICDELLNLNENARSMIPPIKMHELKYEIRRLKDKKAQGFDLITEEVLKRLPNKGLAKLLWLMNKTISLEYVPSVWKYVPSRNRELIAYRRIVLFISIMNVSCINCNNLSTADIISCGICGAGFHLNCSNLKNLNKSIITLMKSNNNICYKCEKCNSNSVSTAIKRLDNFIELFNLNLLELKRDFSHLSINNCINCKENI